MSAEPTDMATSAGGRDDAAFALSAAPPAPAFLSRLAQILNAGQSRCVLLSGNVHDLFASAASLRTGTDGSEIVGGPPGDYLPLLPTVVRRFRVEGIVRIVYELNGPVRFADERERLAMRDAWVRWRSGTDRDTMTLKGLADPAARAQRESLDRAFDEQLLDAVGKPSMALELLRQLTLASRSQTGPARFSLLIVIEGADLLVPAGDGDISRLSPADRHRISIVRDWFCDPGFIEGRDRVILISDSRSGVHQRVTGLPQLLAVDVPAPDLQTRRHFIAWFSARAKADGRPVPDSGMDELALARATAGLTLHALRQLLVGASHRGGPIGPRDVIDQVEAFIVGQLGEGVVQFKRPTSTLDDVVGYRALKAFIRGELIPRLRAGGSAAPAGAAVAGPIGAGKSFIFEAMAGELDLPVLVLGNIRSQFFGQTDALFERLRAVLEALDRVVVFVDEADTQFGGVGADSHETERRLTGRLQQMMSDPALRGRVMWLLMTARIHRLSPDLRRPGRAGDLIIPVLDPTPGTEDRRDFVRWLLDAAPRSDDAVITDQLVDRYHDSTRDLSAAGFAALRARFQSHAAITRRPLGPADLDELIHDQLSPDIGLTRRFQTLQALLNCTRRSLLPDPAVDEATRANWREELARLERAGIE